MGKPSTLDPSDLFDIRSLLSDEERMVQDTVARYLLGDETPPARVAVRRR